MKRTTPLIIYAPLLLFVLAACIQTAMAASQEKIAFVSTIDGNTEIFVMNADGSGQTRLTNNPAYDDLPEWSPDGSKIAFVSNRDGNYEIYVMNADGSGQTRLTNNPAYDWHPSWSPDGSKIAFESNRDGNYEIYVMNADGSGQTRITNSPGYDKQPDWSPDGSKIAFTSDWDYPVGWIEICVMNADGSGKTRLTTSPGYEWSADWSPDGSKIAFMLEADVHDIYVMNADGSGQTLLTYNPDDPNDYNVDPAWSPDGSKIAYTSDGIYVMNADGSGKTRISDGGHPSWGSVPIADTMAPTITVSSPTGGTYLLNEPVTVEYCATDESGVASCSGSVPNGGQLDTGTVGYKSFTVTASDSQGNTETTTVNYQVVYAYSGLLKQIKSDGSSVFNQGKPVQVNFQLEDAYGRPASGAIAKLYVKQIASTTGIELPATSADHKVHSDLFLWKSKMYEYSLNTKTLSEGTWQLRVELDDGTSYSTNIKLK